ncbi:peptidoglycan-binding protein [Aureimonas altamirensis]|uniref:glycoside hydrolase family protein n=1 Tax=Aureimonas altamirensis TaxID=370622 RepID=UPI001E4F8D21|nr:peptidoglycan-binding protein [Aureimonas altamirensis]UHD44903.1 peptidoglycan-binding protein [Aureimonas altamirensis]
MNLSKQGAAFLRHHEGFVPLYYLDPIGVGTIGIGFTWRSTSFREWWAKHKPGVKSGPGATMTAADADAALAFLADREYGQAVRTFLGRPVPQHVFDGMTSVVYNLGAKALSWKWAAAAKRGDYAEASRLLKTTGTTAAGKRLQGLVNRRLDEAELISFGDYTIGRPRTAPAKPLPVVLRRGERGDAVRALQMDLMVLGLRPGTPDGIFGYGTQSALLTFQRNAALKADGIAGPQTLAAINAAIAKRT